jgi:hypothetical protein
MMMTKTKISTMINKSGKTLKATTTAHYPHLEVNRAAVAHVADYLNIKRPLLPALISD